MTNKKQICALQAECELPTKLNRLYTQRAASINSVTVAQVTLAPNLEAASDGAVVSEASLLFFLSNYIDDDHRRVLGTLYRQQSRLIREFADLFGGEVPPTEAEIEHFRQDLRDNAVLTAETFLGAVPNLRAVRERVHAINVAIARSWADIVVYLGAGDFGPAEVELIVQNELQSKWADLLAHGLAAPVI
ncbi:Hypothetical protein HVR_LOCUS140 [uncultured virus]|nr:Hypothetical protein HVR_LOCUS140 [uncultured virus]